MSERFAEIVQVPSPQEQRRQRDIHAAIDKALTQASWPDEEREAALREYAWYQSYGDPWGVMRSTKQSFASGGWAYWLMWLLLIPAYIGMYGRW